MKSVIAY